MGSSKVFGFLSPPEHCGCEMRATLNAVDVAPAGLCITHGLHARGQHCVVKLDTSEAGYAASLSHLVWWPQWVKRFTEFSLASLLNCVNF